MVTGAHRAHKTIPYHREISGHTGTCGAIKVFRAVQDYHSQQAECFHSLIFFYSSSLKN